ncbi:MAG: TRAP transporter fused permease subunit [Pseudomonadota bacterium]|nr:TRAP transporter fused permease subunit [Pseudomonadota bacterium]
MPDNITFSSLRDRAFDIETGFKKPFSAGLFTWGIVFFGFWHVATNLVISEPGYWQNCIHFGGFAFLAALSAPISRRLVGSKSCLLIDIIYGLLVAGSAAWIAYIEDDVYARTLSETGKTWQFGVLDWTAGLLLIFAAIELTRRLTGWIIPILIITAMSYILFFGEAMPGAFRAASLPLSDVLFRSMYNDEGMFGIITTISSANIVLFMIFGAFLVKSGASDFVIEFAKIIAGRFRGGAAFVAVIASALTGTISGSAVANTASTGVITIPLMKANGFRPMFAAGVEAAASTGGQIMPPIMGAGAFVMVSYTGIDYGKIVLYSIVPAILYFFSIGFIVRIEAMKRDIGIEKATKIERDKLVSGALNFIVPLGVMTWMLVSGRTPSYAACAAIAILILTSWFTPNKMTPKKISEAFLMGMKTSIMTAVLLVAVGLINNAVTTSGVANSFALMIAQWSQGSLLIAMALIGLASLVLGMGLPVTAAYIVLAILSAPALAGMLADGMIVDQLVQGIKDPVKAAMFALVDSPHSGKVAAGMGLEEARSLVAAMPFELAVVVRPALVDPATMTTFLLTAHLIIFWLSQDSNITPPVCLAAFTAAGIAGSRPMATGVQSWKIAKGLYIVPLIFAYTPIIGGSFFEVVHVGFFSLFGIYALNVLIQNYAEGALKLWSYPLFILGGALAFWPMETALNGIGAVLVFGSVLLSARNSRPIKN